MQSHLDSPEPKRRNLLHYPAVAARTGGFSKSTLNRWEKLGQFPRRVVISPTTIAWYEDEIDSWIENRQRAEHDARPSPNPKARRRRV